MGRGVFDPEELQRAHVFFQVQLGLKTIREASRELGISPKHYYEVEARALKVFLESLRPGKRGRKARRQDSALAELAGRMKTIERERELMQLKIKDLEEVNEVIRHRIREQEGEKKARRGAPRAQRLRKPVSGRVQAGAAGVCPDADAGGPQRGGPMPEGGRIQGELRFMEAREAPGTREAGAEGYGPPGRDGLPHGH